MSQQGQSLRIKWRWTHSTRPVLTFYQEFVVRCPLVRASYRYADPCTCIQFSALQKYHVIKGS